jgi:serine protease Do
MKIPTRLVLLLSCLAAPLSVLSQESPKSSDASTPQILREYDQAIDQVAERAMQSVVKIEVTGFGKPESSSDEEDDQTLRRQRAIGSGVIVDPDGYIVTNNHVVAGALRIRVIVSPATVELVTGHTQLSN